MQPLAEAAGWLFGWLLRNSAHAAILVLVVWALDRALCRRLRPRWRYGLWLLVFVRLLLPVAPESPLSLFNLVDFAPEPVAKPALEVLGLPRPAVPSVVHPDPLADTPAWFVWALALWAAGAMTLGALVWRDHRRLKQALAAHSPITDPSLLALLEQCKGIMGVRQRVSLVESPLVQSPAVSGCFRPRLLLPQDLLPRLTRDEVRFLFLHELAHLKRADLLFNWLLAGIQVLHWFNPAVWLAVRRILTVREEVCDDLVLRRCFPGAARDYGLTLLRLLEECAPRRLFPAVAQAVDDLDALRHRIRCIRNFGVGDHHSCLAAGLTVSLAIVGLTDRPGDPFLWGGDPSHGASSEYALAIRRSKPKNARPAAQPAREETEERARGGNGAERAAQLVGTIAAALQQALEERVASEKASQTLATPAASSAPPTAASHAWVRTTVNARPAAAQPQQFDSQSLLDRLSQRPYPLPPIHERGSIIGSSATVAMGR